jgi:predicted ABC-type ATPase
VASAVYGSAISRTMSIMNTDEIEQEIRDLENSIAHMKAAKPAHDHRGIYERKLFELEETLAEKRRALEQSGHSG